MFRFLLQPLLFCLAVGFISCSSSKTAPSSEDIAPFNQKELLKEINAVRARGCNCGGRAYAPVPAVNGIATWKTLRLPKAVICSEPAS